MFNVVDQMPARTVKDYENIIARLRALPTYINQTMSDREQLAAGLPAGDRRRPDARSGRGAGRKSAADSPLLAAFRRFPSEIAVAEQDRLRAQARRRTSSSSSRRGRGSRRSSRHLSKAGPPQTA